MSAIVLLMVSCRILSDEQPIIYACGDNTRALGVASRFVCAKTLAPSDLSQILACRPKPVLHPAGSQILPSYLRQNLCLRAHSGRWCSPARALFGDEFEIKAIQLLVEDGIDAERKIVKFTNRVFRDDVSENHATLYSVTK
ncbi:hypothetical protein B0T25DRAFT_523736 [Lasiosphaeria hispida]|uniref:Uncharacterized protein n=1 Tax=Lasiosphaeria hispida TaxID=260671 RepID=A0AAJ0H4M6_9PEZI|nr:hypothetical protein B0T25DRAFT_523736 [Lasiosphaeria hispida]